MIVFIETQPSVTTHAPKENSRGVSANPGGLVLAETVSRGLLGPGLLGGAGEAHAILALLFSWTWTESQVQLEAPAEQARAWWEGCYGTRLLLLLSLE